MSNSKALNSVALNTGLTVVETVTLGNDPTINGSGFVQTAVLNGTYRLDGSAGNGPTATTTWHGQVALTAGAATMDLTSLPDASLGVNVDMSGKKLMAIAAAPDSANANVISIAPGASNGYTGWGSIFERGAHGPLNYTAVVDGTHKTLDLTGTGTEKMNLILVFG